MTLATLLPVWAFAFCACSLNPQPLPPFTTTEDSGTAGFGQASADSGARAADGSLGATPQTDASKGHGNGDATTEAPASGTDGGAMEGEVSDAGHAMMDALMGKPDAELDASPDARHLGSDASEPPDGAPLDGALLDAGYDAHRDNDL